MKIIIKLFGKKRKTNGEKKKERKYERNISLIFFFLSAFINNFRRF